jgi:hypothetical protein
MNRIKHVLFLGALTALAGIGVQRAGADTPSLQDFTIATDDGVNFYDPGSGAPGLNLGGYNTSTGLGTITFTDTTIGSDTFAIWWDEEVGIPFYNEFGTVVNLGSLLTGESYEIGDAYASSIYGDASYDALLDENLLAGTTSNYLGTCVGSNCNGDASTALGYDYSLTSGEEEIITLTVSQTAPGSGFYLQQTNPQEDCNAQGEDCTSGDVYFSLSAEEEAIGSGPPPTVTPEPSTWLLMLSGLLIPAWRMRRRFALKTCSRFAALLAVVAVALGASARAQQVLTVPEDPSNSATPHTAYAGANIILGAVFTGAISGHSYTYSWNYGDGSAATAPAAVSGGEGSPSFNDISSSHIYSGTTPGVTAWTAVVTVNDMTASQQYTGNYLVIWELNTLQTRVNVAIDWGLWYLHQNMAHPNATTVSPGTTGNWRSCEPSYAGYACGNGLASLDANNLLAFEVDGHLPTGPSTDPYTLDVQEGLADMLTYLTPTAIGPNKYFYNPALTSFGCSDGTSPSTSYSATNGYCDPSATPVNYNSTASSCGTPPCTFTFDGNSNGQYVVTNQYAYEGDPNWGYEQGMFTDALVGSGAPTLQAAVSLPAPSGTYASGIGGQPDIGHETFQNIVQDYVDGAGFCQYGYDYDDTIPAGSYSGYSPSGYYRGAGYSNSGGAWLYGCGNTFDDNGGDDNSTSQWTAIGLIVANRGFGISVPPIVTDTNNTWVTDSQNVQTQDYQLSSTYNADTVDNPYGSNTYDYGGFGYRGSIYYSDPWSPWATTPSGMVQMSLDGIGRTANTQFNNYSAGEYSTTAGDQRFNSAETFYADNFCDNPADGAGYSPLAYTYGMYSFTKSMLEHNPSGSPTGTLSPIQYLRTLTPSVFNSTTPGTPPNTIDWYAAVSTSHLGGTDPCDGIAQTLLDRQYSTGQWYGYDYDPPQYVYETAWALIMLQKSVFVACVNNLGGEGTASGTSPARIDLTWTGIPSATGYEVLRSTTSGSGYVEVGTTTSTAYSDRTGLANGGTYYYVLEPTNSAGVTECQSNQATVTIPAGRSR